MTLWILHMVIASFTIITCISFYYWQHTLAFVETSGLMQTETLLT